MNPKEKAIDIINKMENTEHCSGGHFPNKNYCDCVEMNTYQAKQCAIVAVNEMILEFKTIDPADINDIVINLKAYWLEVKDNLLKT